MVTDRIIKKEYKQTELGVIPEDWEVLTLGEIGEFKNGINKSKDAFGFGSPFVNLLDVFGKSSIDKSAELGSVYSNELEKQFYSLKEGDVIFVRSSVKPSGVGLTIVVNEDLPDTVFSGFLIRFRDKGQISKEYKEHCFYEEGFRKRLVANSTVSANTNINQETLKSLLVALPSTKFEQTAIATILSDTDELIKSLEKLIEKKKNIKQGAMQQLLTGKKRLPGFGEGQGYKKTEIGEIPEDWDVISYGEAFNFLSTASYSRADLSDNDEVLYVHYGDIHTTWNYFLDFKKNTLPTIEKIKVKNYSFIKDGGLFWQCRSRDSNCF